MVNLTANVLIATLSIPFLFALGAWRHWWGAGHHPWTYVALGLVALSLISISVVWLRRGVRSHDFRHMLLLAGILHVGLLAGWIAANTSGIVQTILGFLTFVCAISAVFGFLMGITAVMIDEEIDDLYEYDGGSATWI